MIPIFAKPALPAVVAGRYNAGQSTQEARNDAVQGEEDAVDDYGRVRRRGAVRRGRAGGG
jgi:hypothetical protein